MLVIPAIDIKDGNVVRLRKGDFSRQTTYGSDVASMAKKWQAEGAKYLHIVDLDGALEGKPVNTKAIEKIAASINIPFEVGGGIRNIKSVDKLMSLGVDRVILSTAACENIDLLKEAVNKYSHKIAVGVDAKGDMVMTRGWVETSKIKVLDLIKQLENIGIERIIYTDIEKDGMLSGAQYERVKLIVEATDIKVIASGGISTTEDIRQLKPLEEKGLEAVIIGKALYDNRLILSDAIKTAEL